MLFSLAWVLWLGGAAALAGCERSSGTSKAEEDRFRPSFPHICFYEATLPKGASLDDVSKVFRDGKGQFCRWTSLKEKTFIGMATTVMQPTDAWADMNNQRSPRKEVCDIAQVRTAATALAPLNPKSGEELLRQCGPTPSQLRDKSELIPLEPVLSRLREICFAWSAASPLASGRDYLLAFTSNLHDWYTLPVRYAFATDDELQLWADPIDSPLGDTPSLIEWAATREGFTLKQKSCHAA